MIRKFKVCIVAPVHEWDDVRVFQKQAVTLAEVGYDVTLLALSGESQEHRGVHVKPVRSLRKPRFIRFVLLPIVFFDALRERADVYHLHNPDTLPLALALRMFGRKVVYDTHEDFQQRILMRQWIPAPLRRIFASGVVWLERMVARLVNASITTQEAVALRIGCGAIIIGNAPRTDQRLLEHVKKISFDIKDDFKGLRLVYLGGINTSRGVLEMVDSLQLSNNYFPTRLWLLGTMDETLLKEMRYRPGWCYVDYLGRLPQETAFAYVSRSDVGLIVIRDVGDHRYTDPNKIYEYLTFGIPFISSDFPAWRARFGDTDAGWFVRPGDARELAMAIIESAHNPELRISKGCAGRDFISTYNWGNESRRLTTLYHKILTVDKKIMDVEYRE